LNSLIQFGDGSSLNEYFTNIVLDDGAIHHKTGFYEVNCEKQVNLTVYFYYYLRDKLKALKPAYLKSSIGGVTINTKASYKELIIPSVFVIMGLLILATSGKYKIGSITNPEAGFFPMVIGCCIIILGILDFRNAIRNNPQEEEVLDKWSIVKISAAFVVLLLWPALLGFLGYALVTFLVTLALAKLFGLEGWIKPVILGIGTSIFVYICFKEWFYLDLPDGLLIDWFRTQIGG
jgi:putative tricarboxylic transport membrane protein